MFKALFTLVTLLAAATSVVAHPVPFSYLDFNVTDDGATGSLVVHDFDAAHELGVATPTLLLDPNVVAAQANAITQLVDSRLRLLIDGKRVAPHWGTIEILAERQSLRLPFTLTPSTRNHSALGLVQIDAWLFPYDPKHQTFINLYENGELKQQMILDADRQSMKFYSGSFQGRWAVISTFVQAGVHHILIGFDHILFLVGLMLLGGSWRRLAVIVTSFTIGHSVTLSLAVLDIVRISPRVIEPAIALSIVVVGIDTLLVRRQRLANRLGTSTSAESRDVRAWLAAIFGLIHGFGFASVLIQFGLPREALGWSLAAFNVGVELGQLAIVLGILVLTRIAARALELARPESARTALVERFLTLGALAVVAAGVYWFVQRIGLVPGI